MDLLSYNEIQDSESDYSEPPMPPLVDISGLNHLDLLEALWIVSKYPNHTDARPEYARPCECIFDTPVEKYCGKFIGVDFREPLVSSERYNIIAGENAMEELVEILPVVAKKKREFLNQGIIYSGMGLFAAGVLAIILKMIF